MSSTSPRQLHTVQAYHQLVGLPAPTHPLLSVINFADIEWTTAPLSASLVCDFYSIALKRPATTRMKYGQQDYAFDAGLLAFLAPGQVFRLEETGDDAPVQPTGYLLLVHPDALWNTPLATTITQYEYFGYAINEALHLSSAEEATVRTLLEQISQESRCAGDRFSSLLLLAQLELLLRYADRFYHRQFLTRQVAHHHLLTQVEHLLTSAFTPECLAARGLPTVQSVAEALHVSPNYLSGILRALTGQSTQQHLQARLLERAKYYLSTTSLSVGEIAYLLGFEHSQSFSKLFKHKTGYAPLAFRRAFR